MSVSPGLISGPAASQMVLGTLTLHVKEMCGRPRMDVTLAPDHLEDQETELQRQEEAEEETEEQRFQVERATIFPRQEEESNLREEVVEVGQQKRQMVEAEIEDRAEKEEIKNKTVGDEGLMLVDER